MSTVTKQSLSAISIQSSQAITKSKYKAKEGKLGPHKLESQELGK